MERKRSAVCANASRPTKPVGNFVLSPQALDDLDAIWLYIAEDRPDAADRVIAAAYRACGRLAEHPELGPVRRFPGNEPADIRFFPLPGSPNYLVFYRVTPGAVEILRVLHGAQDIDELFGQ